MLETLILEPIFNLLVAIYGLIPGHDFGLAIIIFTIIVRSILWPRTKAQFVNSRRIRELQPDIKRIKDENKDDPRARQLATAELYKSNNINPWATIGSLLLQLPILIGLYQAVRKISGDNNIAEVVRLGYQFVLDLPFISDLIANGESIDQMFLGVIDLSRQGIGDGGPYFPLVAIALAAAIVQFYQTKQITATQEKPKSLRQILRDEASGKQASQTEISAATTRSMTYLMPGLTFFLAVTFPGALALYWLTGGIFSYLMQARLRSDMDAEPKPVVTVKSAKKSQTTKSAKKANKPKNNSSAKPKKTAKPNNKSKKNRQTKPKGKK